MEKKRILFITGTRADYGKIKSLMKILNKDSNFEVFIFATGMHMLSTYGFTYKEIGILLDIPTSSVEFKSRRARKLLRNKVNAYYCK